MLLRDDNVFVRQEASETTSVLIHDVGANNIDKGKQYKMSGCID